MLPFIDTSDLTPYKNLHGEKNNSNPYFICEGRYLVEEAIRAANAGCLRVVSVLCNSRQSEEWRDKVPTRTKLLSLDSTELDSLVGFRFHRGVLCCCNAPEALGEKEILQTSRILVLPQIDNVDNLGQLIRTAATLGMDAILIGRGPEPFSRRCVRVSMGAVWKIAVFKTVHDVLSGLVNAWLTHCPDVETEIVGTALTSNSVSFLDWQPAPRAALVLGTESHGLDEYWQSVCTRQVRIPLARQIDSLNVSAAGAILMGKILSAR